MVDLLSQISRLLNFWPCFFEGEMQAPVAPYS